MPPIAAESDDVGFPPLPVPRRGTTAGGANGRAVFAPFVGAVMETHHDLDGLTFRADDARLRMQGYAYASLASFLGDDGRRVYYQATWVKME